MNDIFPMQEEPENGITFESLRALMPGMQTESREVAPGVWEHLFTPDPDVLAFIEPKGEQSEMTELAGALSFDTLRGVLDEVYANAREHPPSWLIPAKTMQRIRHLTHLGQMYRAHPMPRRKIRKCHMRRLQAIWRKGRAHIRRVEQAEWAREEKP